MTEEAKIPKVNDTPSKCLLIVMQFGADLERCSRSTDVT